MQKIVITGYSGSGKTTLANALAESLDFKVFHVDVAMYDKNYHIREPQEAMGIAEEIMSGQSSWIIDGYNKRCVKEEWLAEADRIFFLDMSRLLCFISVFGRCCGMRGGG